MPETDRTRLPQYDRIPEAFFAVARKCGSATAFKGDGGKGKRFTYDDVDEAIRKVASSIMGGKTAECSEIGILSENRPEWPIAYLSILACGKTVLPIDPNLSPNEIRNIVTHAGLKALFCSGRCEGVAAGLDPNLTVFSFEDDSPRSWKGMSTGDQFSAPLSTNETAVLIYTSGTTGDPKAVELTHRNLLSNVAGATESLDINERDVFLSVLPLNHTFEATCGFLVPVLIGASIVYARSLKSKEIQEDISKNGITIMCGVPLLYEKLFQTITRGIKSSPVSARLIVTMLMLLSSVGWKLHMKWGRPLFASLRRKGGLGKVRMFVCGAAPLPPSVARFFCLMGFDFIQGYGLTETSPILTVIRPDDIRFDSVGSPLPNVEIRIDHPDADGTGEIIARGPNITPGYRNNLEKTKELIRDGWLYTGDLGCLRDGHLYITGRAKNLIISAAGKNIYPEELEEKLAESPYILEAVVFGRKKEGKQGEDVVALLVPDLELLQADELIDSRNPDKDKLQAAMKDAVERANQLVAGYKRITSFDFQLEELQKTSSKKIKRFCYK